MDSQGSAVGYLVFRAGGAGRRGLALLLAGVVTASVLLTASPAPVLAATLTVTTTADAGAGSLRDAIASANGSAGADVIDFAIPGAGPHVIAVASALPSITDSVTIDASAELIGSAPGVVLDGAAAGGASGLIVSGGGSTEIRSLQIIRFAAAGVAVTGGSGTTIRDSYIGTDGATDLGNGIGVFVNFTAGTQILDNVISGNGAAGVGSGIDIAGGASTGTVIRGNRIGTSADGLSPVGNALYGVMLNQAGTGTTIGGTTPGQGNVISGNGNAGVIAANTSGATIVGNLIGVGADGTTAMGNVAIGVQVSGNVGYPANENVIGGTAAGAGNVIAHNGTGVLINGADAAGNRILGNVIRDNVGLGIDLAVVGEPAITENDAGDTDSGVNGLQNFPVITGTGSSDIFFSLDSAPGTYRIEFFQNDSCDPSGNGEGAVLLDVVTGAAPGPGGIDTFPVNGTYLTATATNEATGDTSEFSDCHLVTAGLPAPGTWVGDQTSGGGVIPGDTAFVAAGSGAPAGPAQFTYGAADPQPDDPPGAPSSVWTFNTSAAATGTIDVPWRLTGFHGFAGVHLGLEAVVIRDGDSTEFSEVLINATTGLCLPCVEPAGGFDYDGTVSFPVQAGDIYGFILTGSNGDSNASLYGELVLGTELPTSCADAQDLYGATTDGRYLILPTGGQRFSVHCADMDGAAKDYLELSVERQGAGFNYGQYAAGSFEGDSTVTTSFRKLRFDPATLLVDIGDLSFATSSGSVTHDDEGAGYPLVSSMPYATAMACNEGVTNGTANVNLQGTIFAIDDAWVPIGNGSESYGGATISDLDQVANIAGNGFCGWRTPYPEGPFIVYNPSAGQFGLQLRYLNEPVVSLETPVVFGSISRTSTTADVFALVEGATNTPLTVEVRRSASCTGGVLGASSLVATESVTSDAEGYVAITGVSGIASGDFVAIRVIAPAVTLDSQCVRTTADNDYWPKALPLGSGSAVGATDVIEVSGKARWYRFPIVPDQRITINLTGLPADYDLAVFKDIAKEFEAQLLPEDADDLHQLSAEFAPSVFSPSVFSPSVFSPSVFSPDAYAPSVFSPSVFSPSVFSPSVFSPSVFSPSVFSPSVFSPSVFSPSVFSPSVFSPSVFSPSVFSPSVFSETDISQAFSSAQTRSLIGVSANAGTGPESVVVNTWNNTGDFYVRVSGRAGAFDPDDLFTVTVSKSASSCGTVTDTNLTPRATRSDAGDYTTVILTDSSRLALGDGSPSSLLGKLNALKARPEVDGVLVDLAGDTRVGQLRAQVANNKGCPFAVNLLAQEIKSIVDSYRTPSPGVEPLRYVTIIGDDTVVPFFRYPDQSLLGQESGYYPPVNSDSVSEASLRRDFVLSQDAYGSDVSVDIRTSAFPVPGLAVGRLVETPAEISGMLDAYTGVGGVVEPSSSLVTGYDFLEDAANGVSAELGAGTGAPVNELITPNGVSPLDPASWDAADLRRELLGSRHDLIFLAGHFSANSALAADFATSVITTELAASTVDLTNAIVFSAGCHSGYNLVDSEALAGASLPLDWAQAFAQKRSVLIAGTGYQYGDTDFLEYSERLYRDFARELRAGEAGSTVSVGEALANAKRTYLATTPDIRGIHEKALLEATLFGLPMFGVEMPAGRDAPAAFSMSGGITPVDVVGGPAADLGLATSDLQVTPTLSPVKTRTLDVIESTGVTGTVVAQWLEGPDGVVTNPAEPAIPKQVVDVTSMNAGQVLRGIGFRGGTYTDAGNVLPLTGAPTTELRGVHAPFVSPVFYPMKLATPNYFGELSGTGGTNLIVTPVQHKSDDAFPGRSIRRTFSDLDLRLFYSGNLTAAALSDAPTIVKVSTTMVGSDLRFEAQVVGDPKAAIHEVWIVWTDGNGTWLPLDLVQDGTDSRLWTGILPNAPANIQFVVQAANGVGLVAFDDNLGKYYAASGLAPIATSMTLISPVPTAGQYGGSATVTAELKAGSTALPGKLVIVSIGGSSAFGVTGGDGRVTVIVPLSSQPGTPRIVATFGGDRTHLTASADAPFTISAGTAALSLSVPATTTLGGSATAVATLTGSGVPLIQTSVAFLLTPPGATAPTVTEAKTDFAGQARLTLPTSAVGTYQIEVRYGSVVSVGGGQVLDLRDPVYGAASASATHQVIWPFAGFFAPVDNLPTVNIVKAGSTVPVKFSLGGDRGLAVLAAGYPRATKVTCASGLPTDIVEETSTANSGLTYDATTGQYKYNWKTPKTYVGLCYRFELKLIDGTTHSANFKFK